MSYIELSIEIEPKEQGSDVLVAELSEIGFDSFVETQKGINAYINNDLFSQDEVNELFNRYNSIFKISHSISKIPQQNWNKEWESNFEPIYINDECIIRAPFHAANDNFTFDIVIEPKMSFGTGHHDTTQLMAKQLLALNIAEKSLLDMGCGTGVLTIIAAKKNAHPITAIDIDDWSYENSLENIQKNKVNNIDVYKGDAKILAGSVFHTILANINKNVLLADMATYVKSLETGGNLLISGFFETDIPELTNNAQALGLQLVLSKTSNQWAMLQFIKA